MKTILDSFKSKNYKVKADETFGCNAEIWKNGEFIISIKKFADGIVIFNGKDVWQLNKLKSIIPVEDGIAISGTFGIVNTPTSLFFDVAA